MSNDIQDIIRNNNQSLTNQAGFKNCHLRATQHTLAYVFNSGPEAEAFKLQRELQTQGRMTYAISNNEPNVVIEYRTTT